MSTLTVQNIDGIINVDISNLEPLKQALQTANSAFDKANAANVLAFNTGISANAYARNVGAASNTIATNAFDKANAALANATGTFDGTLTITGNVGIGVTSTGVPLIISRQSDVIAANSAISPTLPILQLMGTDGITPRLVIDSNTNPSITGRAFGGTTNLPSATPSGRILLNLTTRGYGATGWLGGSLVSINMIAEQQFTDTSAPTYIQFNTTGVNSTNGTERMRISSAGNVSIGTTDTSGLLTVNGDIDPASSNVYDLGSSTRRWRNIYTGDLHLANKFGDYTIVEGEDDLFLYNNKKGKIYKFALIEVNANSAPPKSV